jgi:predicted RNA methylase
MKTFQLRQRLIETPNGRSVLSLFTGAGGLDLGLEASGFKPVLCVEIDCDAPRLRDPRSRTLGAYVDSHRGAVADVSEFRSLRSDPE